MGKVLDHQKELEPKIKELLLDYNNISMESFTKSKYTAIKKNDKVILTIYYRANEIRIYIDKKEELLKLYDKFFADKIIYQHKEADENNVKGKLAFFVHDKNELEVIKDFLDYF